jgi:hypothetical protein
MLEDLGVPVYLLDGSLIIPIEQVKDEVPSDDPATDEPKYKRDEIIREQAEAFLEYLSKETSQLFEFWADSKEFDNDHRQAIYCECRRIMMKLHFQDSTMENQSF